MAIIPQTKRRLAGATKFYFAEGKVTKLDTNKAAPFTALINFSETNDRPTVSHYELDSDVYGEIVEETPKYATRKFSIERAVLYSSDLLAFCGVSGDDLINQMSPFTLFKVEYQPNESNPSAEATVYKTTCYEECWFQSNPKDYAINGDLTIIQNVDVKYVRKTITK